MEQLTNNFTLKELTRTSQKYDNTPNAEQVKNLQTLCENVLQPLRDAYGKPIHVNSGYRSLKVNTAVGGAKTSQHMKGQAADITGGSVAENKVLFALAQKLNLPFDQLIDEKGYRWIHISHVSSNRKQILHLK